ncbi:unnamed protein product, partial [Caretta caretta]
NNRPGTCTDLKTLYLRDVCQDMGGEREEGSGSKAFYRSSFQHLLSSPLGGTVTVLPSTKSLKVKPDDAIAKKDEQ